MNPNDRTLQAADRVLFVKQTTGETLKYTLNYAAILGADTITASSWSCPGATITAQAFTDTAVSCQVSADSGRFTLINAVTTSAAEVIERVINLHVESINSVPMLGDY